MPFAFNWLFPFLFLFIFILLIYLFPLLYWQIAWHNIRRGRAIYRWCLGKKLPTSHLRWCQKKLMTTNSTTKCVQTQNLKHHTLFGILNITPHASGGWWGRLLLEAAKRLRFFKWTGHLTRRRWRQRIEGKGGLDGIIIIFLRHGRHAMMKTNLVFRNRDTLSMVYKSHREKSLEWLFIFTWKLWLQGGSGIFWNIFLTWHSHIQNLPFQE